MRVADLKITDDSGSPAYLVKQPNKEWVKDVKYENEKMADQIEKDVNRSLNHFNISVGLNFYRKKLSNIMNALFQVNQEWSYYQGFNDICSVFLYVLTEDVGYYASTSIAHYFVRDFLKPSFDKGVIPALQLMMKVIQSEEPKVYERISFIQIPTFAVSWIITWFAHDLENMNDVYRIFDF